jgi:hypothetical protein
MRPWPRPSISRYCAKEGKRPFAQKAPVRRKSLCQKLLAISIFDSTKVIWYEYSASAVWLGPFNSFERVGQPIIAIYGY